MTRTIKAAMTVAVLGLLSGCAASPSPLPRLQEARVLVERARAAHSPAASAQIDDAEGAIEYAELEYRTTPNHPLSSARADNALAKARLAYHLAAMNSAPAQRPTIAPVRAAVH
jgi:hypothetical protein